MEAAGRPKPPGVGFQPRLPVFVSTSSGTLIRIEVADGDSLEAIKSKIQDKAGMPPSRGSARHGKEARLIATEQTLSRPNPEPGTSSTDEGVLSDQTDNVMSLRGPQRMPQEAAIGTGPNSSAVRNGLVDSWEPSGETKFKV